MYGVIVSDGLSAAYIRPFCLNDREEKKKNERQQQQQEEKTNQNKTNKPPPPPKPSTIKCVHISQVSEITHVCSLRILLSRRDPFIMDDVNKTVRLAVQYVYMW